MSVEFHITCDQAWKLYSSGSCARSKIEVKHQYDRVIARPDFLIIFNIGFKLRIKYRDLMAKFYPSNGIFGYGYNFLPCVIDHDSPDKEINLSLYSIYSGVSDLRIEKGDTLGHFRFEEVVVPGEMSITESENMRYVVGEGGGGSRWKST